MRSLLLETAPAARHTVISSTAVAHRSPKPSRSRRPPAAARLQPPAAMSQPAFGTPLFAEKDIIIFLSELGMSAAAEQLAKPSYEFVQPIFENLVTALMGVTRCAHWGCCRC